MHNIYISIRFFIFTWLPHPLSDVKFREYHQHSSQLVVGLPPVNQLNVLYSVYPVIISDGTDWFHVPVAIWVMEPVLNRPSPYQLRLSLVEMYYYTYSMCMRTDRPDFRAIFKCHTVHTDEHSHDRWPLDWKPRTAGWWVVFDPGLKLTPGSPFGPA